MILTKKQIRDKVVQLIDDGDYETAAFLIAEGLDRDWTTEEQEFDVEFCVQGEMIKHTNINEVEPQFPENRDELIDAATSQDESCVSVGGVKSKLRGNLSLSAIQISFLYDILIASCDASDDPVVFQQFVHHVSTATMGVEFRFQGCLGFGGKFYMRGDEMWVAGYPEDMTPKLEKRTKKVNEILEYMSDVWFG